MGISEGYNPKWATGGSGSGNPRYDQWIGTGQSTVQTTYRMVVKSLFLFQNGIKLTLGIDYSVDIDLETINLVKQLKQGWVLEANYQEEI